ncbi:MAG: 4-oxalomesaconate tautomerase [Octadecabacter sp.]
MSDRSEGVPCTWMRAGTSKGAFFLASDLPADPEDRNALLLRILGSPDPRQIDGIGGGDPLTSKIAILSPSDRVDADVDYLFLQVFVEQPIVTDAQNCGNILAGVGPVAIERGLIQASDNQTTVRIHMLNTGEVATANISTPDGRVSYSGEARIDGVPGHHAPIPLMFENLAGSMCGALLPTGNLTDMVEGVEVTCIDNGMPVVLIHASKLGICGSETREALDGNADLKHRLEAIRLAVGPMMNLGDVAKKSVPKMTLLSASDQATISTRSFIPHRCHATIGVFAAVSVATACAMPGTVAYPLANQPVGTTYSVAHPTGAADVLIEMKDDGTLHRAGTLRTARKLFEGKVFPRDM